jgi:hypothetical protein
VAAVAASLFFKSSGTYEDVLKELKLDTLYE